MKLRRLSQTLDELKNRDRRILDITVDYGFGSHESFTRAFKAAYMMTPEEYRNTPEGCFTYFVGAEVDEYDFSLTPAR